jgi:hypothetical protein
MGGEMVVMPSCREPGGDLVVDENDMLIAASKSVRDEERCSVAVRG